MKDFSIDFFRDEVRDGFFIPTTIKQAWAAQLKVLRVIDEICDKHNITYFADWGTILGTVRHGGYVPWDDDMDICMKREDYIKFKQAAKTELPLNYYIHDYETKDNCWLFLSRVVNNEHICFEAEHLEEFNNFPYLASIDIFVLDYVYEDEEERKNWCNEIKYIISLADMIVEGKLNRQVKEIRLTELENKYAKRIDKNVDNRHIGIQLYRLAEEQMARVPEEQSNRMVQMFPWGILGSAGQDKNNYDRIVRLPFENTTMPVPANYHKILSSKYHDYFKVQKVWSGHTYPYFEKQRDNLQAVADFKLPEFEFNVNMLRNSSTYDDSSMMPYVTIDVLKEIKKIHKDILTQNIEDVIPVEDVNKIMKYLADCQSISIDIGNYIESVKGKKNSVTHKIVESIEQYCESVYKIYVYLENISNIDNNSILVDKQQKSELNELYIQLDKSLLYMCDCIEKAMEKRTVAFLPDNPKRWKELEKLYNYYSCQPDAEVYVIPMPLFRKNPYGEIIFSNDEYKGECDRYPEGLNIAEYDDIDITKYGFDTIVIQNQYDNENPCFSVPPVYYAKNLQKYTRQLIYQMPLGVNDFDENDVTDMYGLKYSLTMPGAMYADIILIESDNMRGIFIDRLTAFAGENTRDIWHNKVKTISEFTKINMDCGQTLNNKNVSTKKRMLYCIGENEFYEDASAAICHVRERLELITGYAEKLDVSVCLYPYNIKEWSICSEKVKDEFISVLDGYADSGKISVAGLEEININMYDAYYGSASPLVLKFVENHKPSMISC